MLIETHDVDYIGHFHLRLTEFSYTRLAFEIGRSINHRVEVSFALSEFSAKTARGCLTFSRYWIEALAT